jgi:hypothetical protein
MEAYHFPKLRLNFAGLHGVVSQNAMPPPSDTQLFEWKWRHGSQDWEATLGKVSGTEERGEWTRLYSVQFHHISDRLSGPVGRVPGYRSRGPGSIPGATMFSEKQWVQSGVHAAL